MKVAEWVANCRKKLGWTQDEAAEKLRVSKATISMWENGKFLPKTQSIMLLANFSGEPLPEGLSFESVSFEALESARISFVNHQLEKEERAIVVDRKLKDCFAWTVCDKSLEPVFDEGITLVIDPDKSPNAADYVLIEHQKYLTVRKFSIVSVENEHFQFVPENGLFPILDSQKNEVKIVGTAREFRGSL